MATFTVAVMPARHWRADLKNGGSTPARISALILAFVISHLGNFAYPRQLLTMQQSRRVIFVALGSKNVILSIMLKKDYRILRGAKMFRRRSIKISSIAHCLLWTLCVPGFAGAKVTDDCVNEALQHAKAIITHKLDYWGSDSVAGMCDDLRAEHPPELSRRYPNEPWGLNGEYGGLFIEGAQTEFVYNISCNRDNLTDSEAYRVVRAFDKNIGDFIDQCRMMIPQEGNQKSPTISIIWERTELDSIEFAFELNSSNAVRPSIEFKIQGFKCRRASGWLSWRVIRSGSSVRLGKDGALGVVCERAPTENTYHEYAEASIELTPSAPWENGSMDPFNFTYSAVERARVGVFRSVDLVIYENSRTEGPHTISKYRCESNTFRIKFEDLEKRDYTTTCLLTDVYDGACSVRASFVYQRNDNGDVFGEVDGPGNRRYSEAAYAGRHGACLIKSRNYSAVP